MKKTFLGLVGPFVICGLSASSQATTITYDLSYNPVSGVGSYDYTVLNNTLTAPITILDIYFGGGEQPPIGATAPQFASLAVTGMTVPTPDWTPTPIPPDPTLLNNGFVDLQSSGAGIAPGSSLSGFSVSFTYTGPEVLGAQYFEIWDASGNLIDFGATQTVPEGSSSVTLPVALAALAGFGWAATAKGRLARVRA